MLARHSDWNEAYLNTSGGFLEHVNLFLGATVYRGLDASFGQRRNWSIPTPVPFRHPGCQGSLFTPSNDNITIAKQILQWFYGRGLLYGGNTDGSARDLGLGLGLGSSHSLPLPS